MSNTEAIVVSSEAVDTTPQVDPSLIQLAGYELKSLLGSGGYGEVWKAIGPGGFAKAVKVLYGRRDGEHAEAELKALNRMRELRHPFLLNIERVEVCNNRLIVVTELADGNLNERFDQCVEQGHVGIPRDELLSYLRDAADALDFMYGEHGLQHLDIKPDNLLLQGKHVKLGDFGLAKDVSVTNVSLINGFTPLYASPELFEGRPGRSSDQYSLAIVYQTMLTGKPPFNGRNAAQLTSQHLRSQPDLTSLAPSDRPAISRALSKTAASRYGSCREMVDELFDRSRNRRQSSQSVPPARAAADAPADLSGDTLALATRATPEAEASRPLEHVDGAEFDGRLRPTLFIGVGGLAGGILRQLKHAWAGGAEKDVPAWQVLALDTDPDSLRSVAGLDSTAQLLGVEALPIGLRSSKEYRKSNHLDMSWLSRRWLFNIPRSARVEGMRPLARLAVQDHLESLRSRIADRMSAASEQDAVVASASALETPFADRELDVIVVAGSSGGTGSGAVIDIGLIVQELRDDFPKLKINVNSVLVHSTGRQQRVDGIQTANTIACIKELRLQSMNGMGIAKGFSQRAADLTPFDHTWLYHGGEDLLAGDFDQLKNDVARLLFNTTATAAASRWQPAPSQNEDDTGEPRVRLLGMATVDSDVYSMAEAEAASLACAVVRRWIKSESGVGNTPVSGSDCVQELLSSLKLTASTLPERILKELKGDSGRRIERLAQHVLQRVGTTPTIAPQERLAAELEDQDPAAGGAMLKQLQEQVRRTLNRESENFGRQLRDLLLELMEAAGVQEKTHAVSTAQSEIQAAVGCCQQLRQEIEQALQELQTATSSEPGNPAQLQELCQQFCVLCGSRAIYMAFEESVRQLGQTFEQIVSEVSDTTTRMGQLLQIMASEHTVHDGIPLPVVEAFQTRLAGDERVRLQKIADKDFEPHAFATQLLDRATGFLLAAGAADPADMDMFPVTAWPRVKGLGGRHRVLAWVPEGTAAARWASRMTQEFGDCVSVFPGTSSRVTALCEIQDVDSARLLKQMQLLDATAWQISERIHTRVDIQW